MGERKKRHRVSKHSRHVESARNDRVPPPHYSHVGQISQEACFFLAKLIAIFRDFDCDSRRGSLNYPRNKDIAANQFRSITTSWHRLKLVAVKCPVTHKFALEHFHFFSHRRRKSKTNAIQCCNSNLNMRHVATLL